MSFEIHRQIIDPNLVKRILGQAQEWFSESERRFAAGENNLVLRYGNLQSGLGISPKWAYSSKMPSGIWDFLSALVPIWQRETLALVEYCSIRRQRPTETQKAFRWHQDALVLGDYPGNTQGVVYWIPLTDVDPITTPTLQLAPENDRVMRHGYNTSNEYLESIDEPNGNYVSLEMKQGDVARFSLAMPHRTYISPTATETRYSIDLRAVHCQFVPPNYKGWAVAPY